MYGVCQRSPYIRHDAMQGDFATISSIDNSRRELCFISVPLCWVMGVVGHKLVGGLETDGDSFKNCPYFILRIINPIMEPCLWKPVNKNDTLCVGYYSSEQYVIGGWDSRCPVRFRCGKTYRRSI